MIIEHFPTGIMVRDKNGIIKMINKNGQKLLFSDKDEDLIGKNFNEKFLVSNKYLLESEKDSPFDSEHFIHYLKEGNEVVIYRKDDMKLIAGEEYNITALIDVSPLEKSRKQESAANQAKSDFLAQMSHEIRTPLTSIMGYVDLSLSFFNKLSEDEIKDNLIQVNEEGKRLERLITGMLRLFSIESEREVWRWKSFGVPWSIADAFQYYDSKMSERELITEIDIQDDLPEIYGDQEKFGMAFNALIDNAVKFNRDGGLIRIKTESRTFEGLDYVYLQIFNEGQTVPLNDHETIFNSYTQLGDIDTEKPHGVGIGLALVKVVVDRMKGDVFLEEVSGEGTCFGLLLPTEQTYNNLKG
jgi:signal transduction histidine kinase